jgi:hypothetical protein
MILGLLKSFTNMGSGEERCVQKEVVHCTMYIVHIMGWEIVYVNVVSGCRFYEDLSCFSL